MENNQQLVKPKNTKIYPSAQREKDESEIFTRFSTFNNENKKGKFPAFGALTALNDETIIGHNKVFRHVEQDTIIIILPLFGAIVYKDSMENEDIIDTEQLRIFSAKKGMTYELKNPYRDGLINYIQIWLTPHSTFAADSQQNAFSCSRKNELFPLFATENTSEDTLSIPLDCYGYVGIYEIGAKASYDLLQPKNGLFCYVISGEFEVDNQHLSAKDGFSIINNKHVGFESLTADAVLLVIEVTLD